MNKVIAKLITVFAIGVYTCMIVELSRSVVSVAPTKKIDNEPVKIVFVVSKSAEEAVQ